MCPSSRVLKVGVLRVFVGWNYRKMPTKTNGDSSINSTELIKEIYDEGSGRNSNSDKLKTLSDDVDDVIKPCGDVISSNDDVIGSHNNDVVTQGNTITEGVGKNEEEEIVIIQDMGYNVKIQSVGSETFELLVSPQEVVQEIHQVLMDREETCYRTCFSLQFEGVTLDNFAELKTIPGLKEGSVLRTVEEPYTLREVRIHLRHIRDLIKSIDPVDSYNAVDCFSLSFLSHITDGEINGHNGDTRRKRQPETNSVDCTPPDYIMPVPLSVSGVGGSREQPPLPPLQFNGDGALKHTLTPPQCLRVLATSSWNPPPGNRKMHGDLMYIHIITQEDRSLCITAATRGFYINQSTIEEFNPKPAPQMYLSHSLIDLLNQVSPSFKKNYLIIQKKRVNKHPYERLPTPFQHYSWTAPIVEHHTDAVRAEDAYTLRLGYEDHIPGQMRDWNEEMQATRELPRSTLPERLIRERAMFKVHSDFIAAATRGAMAVIDGNVMAINPGEDTKIQMFIWNNLFFSLGFDVKDHYKDFGRDHAAFIACNNDLKGVHAFNELDLKGIYTLSTAVIDYRGYRVTAQSIIPGILEREQEQSVVYGSIDFGKTVIANDKYTELLKKSSQALKTKPHKVLNEKGEEVEVMTSVECKGILGNDGRHYILDLLKTFPVDVNFQDFPDEVCKLAKTFGFPRKSKHKLYQLRPELLDAFIDQRYMLFIRHAAFLIMKQKSKTETETTNQLSIDQSPAEQKPVITNGQSEPVTTAASSLTSHKSDQSQTGTELDSQSETVESSKADECKITDDRKSMAEMLVKKDMGILNGAHKDIVMDAAQAVGSLSMSEFDVRFNLDIYSPYVKHVKDDVYKSEKSIINDAAQFLLSCQIPSLISDMEHSLTMLDGLPVKHLIHQKGINMRYLGVIAKQLECSPLHRHGYSAVIHELLTRSIKHVFRLFIQNMDMLCMSTSLSHFLNCLMGSCLNPHPQLPEDDFLSSPHRGGKKSKKRRGVRHMSNNHQDNFTWTNLTPQSLWADIKKEMKNYFSYEIEGLSCDSVLERYNIERFPLLYTVCQLCGIQIQLRNYTFDKQRPTFSEDDIINLFPVVKHAPHTASDALHFFQSGHTKIQQGYLRDGLDLVTEAMNLFCNVYGPMHSEIANCLRLMAQVNYILGDYTEAISNQQKSLLMNERCKGIEHTSTITDYVRLALYCYANHQISLSLKLLYRARYLVIVVFGIHHADMAQVDSNIGLILHSVSEYDLALKFLDHALEVNKQFLGTKSLKTALSYHLLACLHACRGDFRTALQNEKETYAIYRSQLGDSHNNTKDSSDCLKHLTEQAVILQRKVNELYKNGASAVIPPINLTAPTHRGVLDILNKINGFFFIQLSQKDLEALGAELEKSAAVVTKPDSLPLVEDISAKPIKDKIIDGEIVVETTTDTPTSVQDANNNRTATTATDDDIDLD